LVETGEAVIVIPGGSPKAANPPTDQPEDELVVLACRALSGLEVIPKGEVYGLVARLARMNPLDVKRIIKKKLYIGRETKPTWRPGS
jgi:hypothetical protein